MKTKNKQKVIIGSRAKVFHGTADKTTGGLVKDDLIKNPQGRIVSKKISQERKRESFKESRL